MVVDLVVIREPHGGSHHDRKQSGDECFVDLIDGLLAARLAGLFRLALHEHDGVRERVPVGAGHRPRYGRCAHAHSRRAQEQGRIQDLVSIHA